MDENYKKRVTRIKRRSIYERTVVPVLAEDLQTKFDDMMDLGYAVADACERSMQNPGDVALSRELYVLRGKRNTAAYAFWTEVRDRYNNWNERLGVRDGYEVVTGDPEKIVAFNDSDQNPDN